MEIMKNKKIIWTMITLVLLITISVFYYTSYHKNTSVSGCYRQDCHGVDVKCDVLPNQQLCTLIDDYGDWCGKLYTSCEIINGKCELVKSKEFEQCQPCIKKCEEDFKGDRQKLFECAGKCRDSIQR